MIKYILSLILVVLLLQATKAENPDTLMAYMKNSGQKAPSKDSADFYRIILPPDTNVDRDLYRVYDYYLNGKPKMFATSLSKDINLVLDGTCVNFFKNGKRSSTVEFKNGRFTGSATNYYPNGKIYEILKIEDLSNNWNYRYYNGSIMDNRNGYKVQLEELRDSTGKILTQNGNGHAVFYDADFKNLVAEGDMKNYKKEGEWSGPIADSGKYIIIYHKDELKSGESFMKSGAHYTYKQIEVKAVYSDGTMAFYDFIRKNLQYPESARAHGVKGTVTVGFYVETNGAVSDVKVERGVIRSLDEEAVRVISLSPPWVPASKYGIPLRTKITVQVDFYNF